MFSSTVKSRSLVSACGITPIVRRTAFGSCATSCPATRADPAVIGISVVIIRIKDDFPAPFGPSSPKISPSFTAKETSSTAAKSPYRFTICFTSITSGALAATSPRRLSSDAATLMPFVVFPLVLFTSALMASLLLPHFSASSLSTAPDSPAPRPSFPAHTRLSDFPAAPSTRPSEYPASAAPHPAASRNPLPPPCRKLFPEPPCLPAAAPVACLQLQYDRHLSPESTRTPRCR